MLKICTGDDQNGLALGHSRRNMEKASGAPRRASRQTLECHEDPATPPSVVKYRREVTKLSAGNGSGPPFAFDKQRTIYKVQPLALAIVPKVEVYFLRPIGALDVLRVETESRNRSKIYAMSASSR
jgi:hypothetical protein